LERNTCDKGDIIMFRRGFQSFCISLLLLGFVSAANAQLIYYTNLASFSAATNTTLVEDFESITPRETSLPPFTHNGNKYTGIAAPLYIAAPGDTNPGPSAFGVPITPSSVLTANGDEDFTVDFGTPKSVVGFDTYTNNFGPAIIKIYGPGGLLDTYSLTQDSTKVGFWGVVASVPITTIRWTTTNGRTINTGIDNVRVGDISAVPEPGAVGLLLAGAMTGAGLFLRRCRSNRITRKDDAG
jgi:hypothetical protein